MIVIEASAMVEALVAGPADPALSEFIAGQELHAPNLLDFEVAGALRGLVLGRKMERSRLDNAIMDYRVFRIKRHSMTKSLRRMLDLRDNFTAYDASYVVLAQALAVPLLTSDLKMKAAEKVGVEVRILESSGV
ncbi:type II toxin-antitoxin system VapC family toxin [Sphaerisporangium sp. NPDC051017]|uniref:type II toxin-antitoxin system VapC family toxin n=1 Tax=Sphaerisporangium sp. NPDC051017 TaxID=3154636 RepID=UPI0034298DA6